MTSPMHGRRPPQPAAFFAERGLFIEPDFLSRESCARIARRMDLAPQAGEPVYNRAGESQIDGRVRLTRRSFVESDLVTELDTLFDAIRPRMEAHFKDQLSGHQEPQFLIYQPGDHFAPHVDAAADTGAASFLSARLATAVAFLNGHGPESDDGAFGGGELTFYGLPGVDNGDEHGTPLIASPGLLIAFPASCVHSVKPVTHGVRRTIVTWYLR